MQTLVNGVIFWTGRRSLWIRAVAAVICACSLAPTPRAGATLIASYESGVPAAAGQTGAADPASQGWTFTGSTNSFASGYDSGDGGWRTVDGTSTAPANYSFNPLSSQQLSALTGEYGWKMSWTLAMDVDAIGDPAGFSANYYVSPNNGRQNNILTLVDVDDAYRYHITHTVNGSNELVLNDNAGGTFNTGIDITDSPFPQFTSLMLTYDALLDQAVLDFGTGTAIVGKASTDPNRNAVFFGASNSSGQGSAIWNRFELRAIVPEPSTLLIGALGVIGLVFLAVRRAPTRDPAGM